MSLRESTWYDFGIFIYMPFELKVGLILVNKEFPDEEITIQVLGNFDSECIVRSKGKQDEIWEIENKDIQELYFPLHYTEETVILSINKI